MAAQARLTLAAADSIRIKALPVVAQRLKNASITVGNRTLTSPVEVESGSYLEFMSSSECIVYGPTGDAIGRVRPRGDVPALRHGLNGLTFTCDGATDARTRANVTVICRGAPI